MLGHAERVFKFVSLLLAIALAMAFVTLNTGDADDQKRFAVYVVSKALLDVTVLAGLGVLAWIGIRSKGLRSLLTKPSDVLVGANGGLVIRNALVTVLLLCVVGGLVLNGYFLVRARTYFWRFLLQKSYVEGTLERVDSLGHEGRIQDAYNLATKAQRVLTDKADRGRIGNRTFDLTVRVEGSRRLSQRYRRPDPVEWNPITERSYYFGNAEALRLNPQNYEAYDILANLHDRLGAEMEADAVRLCAQGSTFQTVSVLESEVFRTKAHSDCAVHSRSFVKGIWHPDAVGALLAKSREIARSTK